MITYWQYKKDDVIELATFRKLKHNLAIGKYNVWCNGSQRPICRDYSPRFPWKQLTRGQYQYRLKKMKGNKCTTK